ncbi:purine-nucleoside phosphorylase [Candidatus Azobacteroides pseudotrichonymphae]|uniref:Purine nucleoside phosphorylase n=1 Tax=Azobacteroides pseudotrichonymphae genomovar. CFP2 TaxID=511995 RepID=B6YR86_AZOPC|nr:purine-nucleoside phosphorylase [Candidatus Azobacteroides pseudotrichonymphae]BAG83708.1 purine-nucleoside phosphorylase [Candidatus Azobacteroides pseudotrichonymphae genomovar. CFP2]
MLEKLKETVSWLRPKVSAETKIGIILGTGLGELANSITNKTEIPYEKIPHFPISTVEGHNGKLLIGQLGEKSVAVMQGRFHYYEGYDMSHITYPVRVMQFLEFNYLIISNAAGGINATFQIGDIMLIEDHINLFPKNPLRGRNFPEFGVRFPDMSQVYDKELRSLAISVTKKNNIKLQFGTYVGVQGPTFETPAEYNYFRIIGGDAIGMSTIPEVIVARHGGLRVLAFSIITDLGILGKIIEVNHKDVRKAGNSAQPQMAFIIKEIIKYL